MIAHNLGFPRLGPHRDMKKAVESYWRGDSDGRALAEAGAALRRRNWAWQADAGLAMLPAGDFSWYDHVLDLSVMLGVIPERFRDTAPEDVDTMFRMARGRAPSGRDARPCEMTKWFDTNYHYIVPELSRGQRFEVNARRLIGEVEEALALGHKVKPVLVGPLTWLRLGKSAGEPFDRLELLPDLADAYTRILAQLSALPVEWVQLDEPVLATDLPGAWRDAFRAAYERIDTHGMNILLAVYFGELNENFDFVRDLPVAGLHLDATVGGGELERIAAQMNPEWVLSAGVVSGRNVWRNRLGETRERLAALQQARGGAHDKLWVAPGCSLLHIPVDLELESGLGNEVRSWLAFARQKVAEVGLLARALRGDNDGWAGAVAASEQAAQSRRRSPRTRNPALRARVEAVTASPQRRKTPYRERAQLQHRRLNLPLFPTTTIGSFPQTARIRETRRNFRSRAMDRRRYTEKMRGEIADAITFQEKVGLDVLVHGEPERNDMVEYFGELLDGFALTANGWVQSYGSRCIKPPIIVGDITRPAPMTVEWSSYAQSLTRKPVKGMLTGAVTILRWSFPRDDISQRQGIYQIALALRDEVADLEKAGIRVIQVDEPALREGLPLRKEGWRDYLDCAVRSFHLTTGGVADDTQIHTHMCYSEFNDILDAIAALDSDVISIEASRSNMELLDAFEHFDYPNEIGPGVYDIHSPRVPPAEQMAASLAAAQRRIAARRLWVNPDCGLKTRGWEEVSQALANMVEAAKQLRREARGRD